MQRLSLLLCTTLIAGAAAAEPGWPQWRGPDLDGSSSATDLPLSWSPDSTIRWKLPLPARGGSTPIVAADHVFLSVSFPPEASGRLELWGIDLARGEKLWAQPLGGGNELRYKQHMDSPSPVTDGKTVWVITGTGILATFGVDGAPRWKRDLPAEYGPFGQNWGYASSPLLWRGDLFVPVLHGMRTDEPSYLLRIDGETGETLWRHLRPTDALLESPDAYTTPMPLVRADGSTEIVILGGDVLTGHDPDSGAELWRLAGVNPTRNRAFRLVASPLITDHHIVITGKRGPLLAYRVPTKGGARAGLGRAERAGCADPGQ